MKKNRGCVIGPLLLIGFMIVGCRTTYYSVWEQLGKEKRHLLKHNLNAQAIGALKAQVRDIELDAQALIADMNKSIHEADELLKTFQ